MHMEQQPHGLNGIQRRSSFEATSKDLTPTPPPPPPPTSSDAGGCRLGPSNARHPLVDFCTLRRPPSNHHRPRAVQFADQTPVKVDMMIKIPWGS